MVPINKLPVFEPDTATASATKWLTECPTTGAFLIVWVYNDRLHSHRAWYDSKGRVVWRHHTTKDHNLAPDLAPAELLPMVKVIGFIQFEGDLADGF